MKKAMALLLAGLAVPVGLAAGQEAASGIINLYGRARAFALKLADRADEMGRADVAQELRSAVEQADSLMEEARSLYEEGNVSGAVAKAREAINLLRDKIVWAVDELEIRDELGRARRISAAIKRVDKVLDREEAILNKMEQIGVDVSEPRSQVEEARSLLDDARQKLQSGDLDGAEEDVRAAADLAKSVAQWIREHSDDVFRWIVVNRSEQLLATVDRVEEKLEQLYQRLVEENRTEAAQKVREVLDQLYSLEDQLREALAEGRYDDAAQAARQIIAVLKRLASLRRRA